MKKCVALIIGLFFGIICYSQERFAVNELEELRQEYETALERKHQCINGLIFSAALTVGGIGTIYACSITNPDSDFIYFGYALLFVVPEILFYSVMVYTLNHFSAKKIEKEIDKRLFGVSLKINPYSQKDVISRIHSCGLSLSFSF